MANGRAGPTARVRVVKVQPGERRRMQDRVATEEPLEIRVIPHGQNPPGVSVTVTMRTPGHDFDLAAGFLYAEGIVPGRDAIRSISYCVSEADGAQQYNIVNVWLRPGVEVDPARLQRNFGMTSACGVCGKASLEAVEAALCARPSAGAAAQGEAEVSVRARVLGLLPERLRAAQPLFEQTGGLHAAGLFDPEGNLLAAQEDVGRHNAVDKVVGHALLQGLALSRTILMVSSRTSFEIMQKAAVAGIPVVASVGAPSSLAVELADRFGLTLAGFVRPDRCNLYAGADRVGSD